ncbi:M48 family metallopeptidase [Thermaurantiacus tibetensis]|uniref:M48 family metallopeptidase n=1 Tax=Thermaurantiacus tibetensis TaxID=2759035 RepID=UPI00188DFCB6|nr:YgjP-like metallopeptidase domain-containing protein [Thermaurantiacus tibetensis]
MTIRALRLAGRDIPLAIRRNARSRRIVIRPCPQSRTVRLTLPARAPLRAGLLLIEANRDWLEAEVRRRFVPPMPFRPGMRVAFAGGELRLEGEPGRRARLEGDRLVAGTDGGGFNRRAVALLRKAARARLAAEAEALARPLGLAITGVRVGDPVRRWGSCARNGRIAFSWRLALAPDEVRRAVVAHEVAHLLHFDHSRAFHAAAERLHGGPLEPATEWLRRNGAWLHAFGVEDG